MQNPLADIAPQMKALEKELSEDVKVIEQAGNAIESDIVKPAEP